MLVAPLRGKGARRRWYAEIRLFDAPTATRFDPAPVRWTATRAGGPGGQNVNRRATAVRAVDPGTGLTVRVAEHRHQGRNARIAVARLSEHIAVRDAVTHAQAAAERRATHDDVRRRPPDHTWELDARGRLHRAGERPLRCPPRGGSLPGRRAPLPLTGYAPPVRALYVLAALALVVIAVDEVRGCRRGGLPVPPPDPTSEPTQAELTPPEEVTVRRGDRDFVIHKTHTYAIAAKVVSATTYDLAWTNDFFDVDLGVVWGPRLAELEERLEFYQDHRWLFWRSSAPVSAADRAHIESHVGNQHLIPADGKPLLAAAIRSVEAGELVEIEGALVEILDPTGAVLARSSTSRGDTGGGACEIVWVERLRIGDEEWR